MQVADDPHGMTAGENRRDRGKARIEKVTKLLEIGALLAFLCCDQRTDIVDDDDLRFAPAPVIDVGRAGIVGEMRIGRLRGMFEQG